MIVIGSTSSPRLTEALANELNASVARTEIRIFPDGEKYVRILAPLDGEHVVLVGNAFPDDKIIELLLLSDAIGEFDFDRLTMVIPYFGYARQDKKFDVGEPVSSRAIVRAVEDYPDRVLTVDIHSESIIDEFETTEAFNVSGHMEMANKLKEIGVDFVLSPDEGRMTTAEKIGKSIGVPSDYMVKERIDGDTVRIEPKAIDVKGKRVAIVDDIISTGGTIANASMELKRLGSAEVMAACTHGLFAKNALERLAKCCDLVISSDTLENPTTTFSVAPAIAREIS